MLNRKKRKAEESKGRKAKEERHPRTEKGQRPVNVVEALHTFTLFSVSCFSCSSKGRRASLLNSSRRESEEAEKAEEAEKQKSRRTSLLNDVPAQRHFTLFCFSVFSDFLKVKERQPAERERGQRPVNVVECRRCFSDSQLLSFLTYSQRRSEESLFRVTVLKSEREKQKSRKRKRSTSRQRCRGGWTLSLFALLMFLSAG